MRLLAILCALMMALGAASASAQPLPASLRSAGITQAQWSQAQGVIRWQATSLNLREDAVRTLAVEIFEGQPDLSFDACVELIRNGAQRLPQLVASARALDPGGDATLVELQSRAVAAAEDGRLREALAAQDEYRARYRTAIERAIEQPLLNLAAAHAAAGDTAFALGDYLGAAARYAEAAEAAPPSAVAMRWNYRRREANAHYERALRFAEPLDETLRLYEQVVLPLAPRETRPVDWARTQVELGWTRVLQGIRYDNLALATANENFAAAIVAYHAVGENLGAAEALRGQGVVFRLQAEHGASGALAHALAALEAALAVRTREVDPAGWALTEKNLGDALLALGSIEGAPGSPAALDRAVAAYEAALTELTPEATPTDWAGAQLSLGTTHTFRAELGAPGALEQALAAYEAALAVNTREANPVGWADATWMIAYTYLAMGRTAEARIALQGALEVFEQTGNTRMANSARRNLAALSPE